MSESWHQWEGEDMRTGVGGYKCGGTIVYSGMKMEK
jgi:hypothetical protein